MTAPQFIGRATASFECEDDGSKPSICVAVNDDGWGGQYKAKEAFAFLSIEDAATLAEQIDAAIDLSARTARTRAEAKAARIAALKATLAELESGS